MRHDLNLTEERPTFVSHLECSLTGERYPADEVHGLPRAGRPLLVRYDAMRWEDARTIAAGIRVPQAVGDFLIIRAVRESGGFAIAVTDAEIAAGVEEVARIDGLLMCPEGGATWAAYRGARVDGRVKAGERVVLFNCASGLKYPLPRAEQRFDLGGSDLPVGCLR